MAAATHVNIVRVGLVLGLVLAAQIPIEAAQAHQVTGAPDSAVVTTRSGPVRGTVAPDHRSFLGIPYAAPPVGERRWASPQPVPAWSTVRDATTPGGDCPQPASALTGGTTPLSEDCLHLNVTTPTGTRGAHLPVMVWFHGGAFTNGSGRIYDPLKLVTTGDVIVVTVNYRLGALGFLAHPALDGSGAARSGAFGVEDQQAALRWVRDNAAAFGGNPGNVTIFGESAGAMSTCDHLAAPASAGLFHRAIIESGPCTFLMPPTTSLTFPIAQAEATGAALAERVGCAEARTAATCLRGVPVADLLVAAADAEFWPVHGGAVIPVAPARALATGRFNKVPVLEGTNRDEQRLFIAIMEFAAGHAFTEAEYAAMVSATYGADAAAILARYPVGDYTSPGLALSAVLTDAVWSCPALETAQLLADQVPTWSYEFSDARAPWLGLYPAPDFPAGAYHGAELQYLFGGPFFPDLSDAAQQRLSDRMLTYWTRFARTGDPNGATATTWPRFTPHRQATLAFTADSVTDPQVDLAREHRCGFWNR